MSKRLVFENEFAHLWFYPETGILHHQFHKFIWGEAYQRVLNEGLAVLERERVCKWLSENRDDTAHSRADTEWVTNEWFPRAVKAGFKFWAIVPPQNVLGEMNMKRIVATILGSGVDARLFRATRPALDWLESAHRAP